MKNIHPKLEERLTKLRREYVMVTEFAEMLPLFADEIINQRYAGDMYCRLASRYKDMYFAWDISWNVSKPTNFPEDRLYHEGVICVYVNCISMFGDDLYYFANKRLREHMKYVPCYFYDDLNTTWYFKPNEIENGLHHMYDWYVATKAESAGYLKEIKRKQLEAELEKLNAE
jgi:hypothetical protein